MSAGRIFLEALRLDREPLDAVRQRARAALDRNVGGFLWFGGDAEVVARLIEELRDRAGRPLWMAADLERGAGQQFRGLTTLPPPSGLASHPEPQEAVRAAARRTALEAADVGLNLVLAPVLDLDVEPRNPIVGTRSFGADPDLVAALGAAWVRTCQAAGVAACAKHFPGHGRTIADSHAELPVVAARRRALEADLTPFRAVASQVECVMTAHVAFPSLGGRGPATLEPRILQNLLRDELGFGGLVLTDALNMSGVRGGVPRHVRDMGSGDVCLRALLAGCDLLLYPPDLVEAVEAIDRVAHESEEAVERLEQAAARVERAAAAHSVVPTGGEIRAPAADADVLARDCVATVGGPIPSWLGPDKRVSVVAIWDDRDEPDRDPFGLPFKDAMQRAGWTLEPPAVRRGPLAPTVLLVGSTPQAWKGTALLSASGRAAVEGVLQNRRVYPVVFGHRRLLESLDRPGLCAWGTEPVMERAAAHRLVELARARP